MNLFQRFLYSPLHVHMVVTRRCNLACGYCNEADTWSAPVPREQLECRILKLREFGTLALTLTGGEPLLHPELIELVRYAKRHIPLVGLITNGFLLTEERIADLHDANLDGLQISVDGVSPNETTVKVLAHPQRKLILLAELARFRVHVNIVIGAVDPSETLAVFELCNSLHLTTTVSVVHDGNGQISLGNNGISTYAAVNRIRRKPLWDLSPYQRKLMEKGQSPFKCKSGSRYLYVDEFGKVQWCSQQRGVLDLFLADYSVEDLRNQFYRHKECSNLCTLNCARKASAFDAWRRQAKVA